MVLFRLILAACFALASLSLPASSFAQGSKAAPAPAASSPARAPDKSDELHREISHQIRQLPYYSVFDFVEFSQNGGMITLNGQVLRPSLKSSAERAVKSIEGVSIVVNQIEILPISPVDDGLRRAVYRAIYEDDLLEKYGSQAIPSIHIVVKDGTVKLKGAVTSDSDRKRAAQRAASVAEIRSFENQLVVRAADNPAK